MKVHDAIHLVILFTLLLTSCAPIAAVNSLPPTATDVSTTAVSSPPVLSVSTVTSDPTATDVGGCDFDSKLLIGMTNEQARPYLGVKIGNINALNKVGLKSAVWNDIGATLLVVGQQAGLKVQVQFEKWMYEPWPELRRVVDQDTGITVTPELYIIPDDGWVVLLRGVNRSVYWLTLDQNRLGGFGLWPGSWLIEKTTYMVEVSDSRGALPAGCETTLVKFSDGKVVSVANRAELFNSPNLWVTAPAPTTTTIAPLPTATSAPSRMPTASPTPVPAKMDAVLTQLAAVGIDFPDDRRTERCFGEGCFSFSVAENVVSRDVAGAITVPESQMSRVFYTAFGAMAIHNKEYETPQIRAAREMQEKQEIFFTNSMAVRDIGRDLISQGVFKISLTDPEGRKISCNTQNIMLFLVKRDLSFVVRSTIEQSGIPFVYIEHHFFVEGDKGTKFDSEESFAAAMCVGNTMAIIFGHAGQKGSLDAFPNFYRPLEVVGSLDPADLNAGDLIGGLNFAVSSVLTDMSTFGGDTTNYQVNAHHIVGGRGWFCTPENIAETGAMVGQDSDQCVALEKAIFQAP